MPKEIYESLDDGPITMEWERELVTVPVALVRGQFTSLDPEEQGEKFCKAHFLFQGVSHMESVPRDSNEDPCDMVREWLKGLKDAKFTGQRLTPIRLGELIFRAEHHA